MSDFLELLETVKAEDAHASRLFGDAGTRIRGVRRDTPQYQRAFNEALDLYDNVLRGRTPMHRLQEAMTTDDFPLLMGDVLDRMMLGIYNEWPVTWRAIARRGTVRDFRTAKRFTVDGAEAPLDKVKAGSEYPAAKLTEGKYEYFVEKRGRRVPFLWEVFVNDDLDSLRDTPRRLAKAARLSEEKFSTGLYASSTGPNATFFSAPNGNLVSGAGSQLDVDNLEAALTLMWTQVDTEGNPIATGQVRLVVPPQLKVTANNIVRSTQIRIASGSGASVNQLVGQNWMTDEVAQVEVNPWLPIIDTTRGDTAWYLFADPEVGRPALEVGFLRGNEEPALFMKSPNAVRIGGGLVAAEDGDFEHDGIEYKIRHVYGGTLQEPKAAVASTGEAP